MMCYDYHGKWDKKTGHNAPLHSRPTESPSDQILNVEYTLAYLLKRGARPEKTVLGVPLYGRAYTLGNTNSNKMGAPAKDTSFQVSIYRIVIFRKIYSHDCTGSVHTRRWFPRLQ